MTIRDDIAKRREQLEKSINDAKPDGGLHDYIRFLHNHNDTLRQQNVDLLEALKTESQRCDKCRCDVKHHRAEGSYSFRACWLCMDCSDFQDNTGAQAAIAKAQG